MSDSEWQSSPHRGDLVFRGHYVAVVLDVKKGFWWNGGDEVAILTSGPTAHLIFQANYWLTLLQSVR